MNYFFKKAVFRKLLTIICRIKYFVIRIAVEVETLGDFLEKEFALVHFVFYKFFKNGMYKNY